MKRDVSRLLTGLLVLLAVLGLYVATASAADSDEREFTLWVGGTQVTTANASDVLGDGKVSFDPATNTLTLTNATVEGGIYAYLAEPDDGFNALNIVGEGEKNVITQSETIPMDGKKFCSGIQTYDLPVTISGKIDVKGYAYGIAVYGDLTISNAEITANGIEALYDDELPNELLGQLNITDSTVKSETGLHDGVDGVEFWLRDGVSGTGIDIKGSTVTATSKSGWGLYCGDERDAGVITITDSTVVAKSIPTDEGDSLYYPGSGIYTYDGHITIFGSEVTAEGANGIYVGDGDITITGGKLTANGLATGEMRGNGIYAGYDDALKIYDAEVNVDGKIHGIRAVSGGLWIYGGSLECKSGYTAIEVQTVCVLKSEYGKKDPVVTVSVYGDGGYGIDANDILLNAGEITVTGDVNGIHVTSVTVEGDGLEIGNGITKVTIEGTEASALVTFEEDSALGIILNDQVVVKVPEGGRVSDASNTFWDSDEQRATKVVLVRECAVTFDANGGTGEMTGATVDSGSEYELPACGYVAPKGHAFVGWLVGDSTEAVDAGTKIKVEGSVVIKPKWAKIVYKITKGADGTWKEGDGDFEIVVVTEPDPALCWPNFVGVSCGGTAWTNGTEYTASEGSTKILIKEDSLKALAEGEHEIVIAFKDAEVATTLTTSKQEADNGGDDGQTTDGGTNGGTDGGTDDGQATDGGNSGTDGGNNGGTDGQATDGGNSGTDGGNNGGTDGQATDGGNSGTDGGNNGGQATDGGNNGGTDGGNGNVESPKTGDSMPYAVLLLIAAMAGAGIGASVIFRRRSERA